MKPEIKKQLTDSFQLAFDNAENEAESRKLYKSAEELGIKIKYINDAFNLNYLI